MIELGAAALTMEDVAAVARRGTPVHLGDAAVERMRVSNGAVSAMVRAGTAIYGVTTGLGAAVDTGLAADDAAHQRRIPLARSAGIGQSLPADMVRATVLARLSRMARGVSGVSPGMAGALAAMLNRGVTPEVPLIGSIGEADLIPLAHVAAVLSGEGWAEWRGTVRPGSETLALAGISVPPWGPKDGLALVSSNAAAVGAAALLLLDAERALEAALAAAALSFEGFRAGLAPLDARTVALRPAPGQADASRRLLALLAGGDLTRPGAARRLQDPLSFRVAASVHGAAAAVLATTRDLVELELNTSDDNPAILDDALPTANFDATALALAAETLGQALLRAASASAGRVLRLMSPSVCDLPRFLAAPGRNGFATVQKTLAALLAAMQHDAAPMPVTVLPVADGVEDYASMAFPIVFKTGRVLDNLRYVVAIELMVAARACDLRHPLHLGDGTARIHAAIRAGVPPLDEDRPTGPDLQCLHAMIADGRFA